MRIRRYFLGLLGVVGVACSTPSVPLPPPAVDTSALSFATGTVAGEVVLSGRASTVHARVRFFAIDTATGDGVIAETGADGAFTAPPLPATVGDTVELYFQTNDGNDSTVTCVTLLIEEPLVGASCP